MVYFVLLICMIAVVFFIVPYVARTTWARCYPDETYIGIARLLEKAMLRSGLQNMALLFVVFGKLYSNLYAWMWKGIHLGIHICCGLVAYSFALPVLVGACLWSAPGRMKRLAKGELPRLVWGPYPNLSWVEISRAMRDRGYVSDTVLYYNFDRIWSADAFSFCLSSWLRTKSPFLHRALPHSLFHPFVFAWLVTRYDIFHGSLFPGYLKDTPFVFLELQLLRLAGCKSVRLPIGGDVCDMTTIDSLLIRQGIVDMYPYDCYPKQQRSKRRMISYNCQHADFIMGQSSYMLDALPRWDLLTSQYAAIDTEYWQGGEDSGHDGKNGIVRIGHSPNHRPCKGSNFLIRAVNELRDEGYSIDLVLLEGYQNTEVRDLLRNVDIIVADLVLQGYAIMGMEGMSLGKPVVQDISDPHYNRVFKLYTGLDEAPFVSTPIEDLKENLRELIEKPELRVEIGKKSREYALKYHSYEAVSKFWMWIYDYLWFARRERVGFFHPDWPLNPLQSLNMYESDIRLCNLRSKMLGGLENYRKSVPGGRVAFYPYSEETAAVVRDLYHAKCIRSDDLLLMNRDDVVPAQRSYYPQRIAYIEDIATLETAAIVLVAEGAAVDDRLLAIAKAHPDTLFSVNDVQFYSTPEAEKWEERPYRKLRMTWTDSGVMPLHFSNFAYINFLKRHVKPGAEVLDCFAGPGTVGLSLVSETDASRVDFWELNPASVDCVRRNMQTNFSGRNVGEVYLSDCFDAVPSDRKYDLIVGNPPHNLDTEGKHVGLDQHLFNQAFDAGMQVHEKFFRQAKKHLKPGGEIMLLENGDVECILPKHLEKILAAMPEYEVIGFEQMKGSAFYVARIGLK